MMDRAYYTYFDSNYAVRAVAMYRSLRRNTGLMHLYIFCLDDKAHMALRDLRLPDVTLIHLSDLEGDDSELLAVKSSRSIIEYYFTCTSCAGWYLMRTHPEINILTYLDADLFFYSSVEPLFHEFEGHSIGAMYQRFPEHGAPGTGKYNVGWLSWRRDEPGLACLAEYRRLCLEWCFLRHEAGKFADQAYLDAWEKLPAFHAFQHRGANVASWNLSYYKLSYGGDAIQVDGYPLIFFHFHGFKALGRNWFDTNLWDARRLTGRLRGRLIRPYIDELRSTGLALPLTNSRMGHFAYRSGLGALVRNAVRMSLAVARCTFVRYPPRP